jgi:hypothetical protein
MAEPSGKRLSLLALVRSVARNKSEKDWFSCTLGWQTQSASVNWPVETQFPKLKSGALAPGE